MKNFTQVNNSQDILRTLEGLKSRIRPLNSRFTLVALSLCTLLMSGGFITRAWALGNSVPTYNGSTWYSLYDATKYDNDNNTTKTRNLNFDVVPPTSGTIYLDWRKNDYWPGADIYVNDTKIAYVNAMSNSHKSFETVNTSLGEDATTVKIGIHGSSKHSAEVESLKVAMKPHIRLDNSDAVGVTSKSGTLANTIYGNTSAAYHIDLRSFLMQNDNLTYTSSNSEFHFGGGLTTKSYAVKANSCAYGSGESGYDCTNSSKVGILGNPDSYEVDVYFTPSANVNAQRNCTITIKDGNVERATVILTAKVIPTYYFKATSVATDGTSTLDIPVKASFTSGVYSGSTLTISQTAATADVASLTKTAYFYAPASKDDYQFQGWYETAACNGERVSTDNTISFNITSNALSAGTAVEKKYYAKYLEEIRAEFGGSDQVLMVDGGYDGISYSRTSEEHPTAAASAAEAAAAGKHFWYEIIVDDKTDVTTGSDDDSKVIDFDPSSNHVTAVNAGTARLILHQEATGLYVDVDKTYTFTVSKLANAVSCATGSWSNSINFEEEIGLSSNNAAAPLIVTRTSGDADVTTYDAENKKIVANFRVGTATWSVSQAEDYKYQAASAQTLTVNVGTIASPGCDVLETQTDEQHNSLGGYTHTHTWSAGNVPDRVSFQVAHGTGSISYYAQVEEQINGGDWVNVQNGKFSDLSTSYRPASVELSPNATGVRFFCSGSMTGIWIKDVRVTRKKYFDIENADREAITEIDMPSKTASGAATTATFYVDYSTCDDVIKVVSDHPHITVSDASFSSTTAGRKAITLTYNSSETEEISATITIYTQYEHETLTVNAETLGKLSTTLEYIGSDSYSVNADNVAATSLFQVRDQNGDLVASPAITLSSSNTSAINTVSSNTAIDFLCGADDVRITASYAGDATYAAASNSGTFYHDIDVIKLAASFTWSNVADDDKIHVWADSDIPSSIVSANTAINGLTSGNSDRLTVSGSKGSFSLHAGHKGEVTLTATSEGDCTYSSGTSSKTIVVEPCFHGIVWDQNFMGLMADENGDINTTIPLTAYAVDSSGVATNKTITYTLEDDDFASIDGNKLRITGTGTTTIYATTADDNKYAVAEASLAIRVRTYGEACDTYLAYDEGEHHVSSYTNNKGKVYSWDGPADSIWVKVGKQSSITTQSLHIYTYDKDNNETDWQDWGVGSLSSGGENKRLKLPEGTVKIKFQGSGTQYKWYSNLVVTQKRYFTADKSSIDRSVGSPVPVNMPFSETITVSYSDVPLIQYSYTGQYLTLTPLQTVENDCGDYGTYSFVLSGVFPKVGSHNEHIYFRTSAGDEIDIPVTIAVTTSGTFRFDQTAGEWGESTNWTYGSETTHGMTPTIANDVIIEKNVTVVGEVSAYGVTIMPGATVTVAPTGGLTVGAGGVRYSTNNNLILQAGTEDPVKGKTGYLRISPHYTDTMPHAKVEMYSIAYHNISSDESDDAKWQHVGIPVATDALAKTFFSKSWIYSYEESSDTWVNNRKTLVMEPFVGYATTQYKSDAGMLVTFPGQLVPNRGTKIIDLEYSGTSYGHNRIANSYAAPIDITQFRDTDFIRAEKTIYIYNTGSKNNSSLAKSATGNNAGQWTAVSIGTAAEMATRFAEDPSLPKTIAPMQGFCVNAQAAGAKFKLNYNKLVWNADYSSHAPTALRAPKRNADAAEEEEMPITGSMKMTLEANGLTDNIYLLESERYMADFEDGYDAHKMESGTLNIFTVENEDKLAIDATNSIIGTRVGVRTGEETAYTITFSYVDGEQEWALYDAETDEMIDITNDNTYTFFAEPNSNITERFMIVESNGAQIPAVTTGNDKVTSDVRAHKFIKDGELFILKNGVLYDVTGARVK